MIRVLLFGACGRMGRVVSGIIQATNDFELVAGVESRHRADSKGELSLQIIADGEPLPEADVWIEFSVGSAVKGHLEQAAKCKKPVIVAATGYDSDTNDIIRNLSTTIPILVAPNLSTGMAVMDKIVGVAASSTQGSFDPAIFEMHHRGKKDAPSGTAKKLAETVEVGGQVKPQMVSLRAGGAIGEHRVHFVGEHEELIVTHRATSREAFASGIPAVVRFLNGCDPGLYTMQDVFSGR